jgi:hypothetical protein
MLEQRLVTREEMIQSVRGLLNKALEGLSSADLDRVQLLNIARKGGSHVALVDIAHRVGLEDFKRDFFQPKAGPGLCLYMDDCLFTGNTLRYDLQQWFQSVNPSTVEKVCLLFHTVHSGGLYYVSNKIRYDELLPQLQNKPTLWYMNKIQNRFKRDDAQFNIQPYDCFWPESLTSPSSNLLSFIEKLNANARLYRPTTRTSDSSLFSSPEARQIVEHEFLDKGAFIMAQPETVQRSMRPLGYENLNSLGFGAMYVTYRNISNNCPLVFWWGDPNKPEGHPFRSWYPLIPRKTNTTG